MISDEQIQKAAAEYEEFFLTSLQEPASDEHIFSEKFEAEMQKINRQANRMLSINMWKRAAIIVLVSGLLFGMLVLTNASVRASLSNWVNWQYAAGSGHLPNGATPPKTPSAFNLTWIPSNYIFIEKKELSNGQELSYKNPYDHYLTFKYIVEDNSNYFFNEEDSIKKNATVFGLPATLYLSTDNTRPNVVVWKSHDNGVLFIISAYCEEQILLKIAESVRPVE